MPSKSTQHCWTSSSRNRIYPKVHGNDSGSSKWSDPEVLKESLRKKKGEQKALFCPLSIEKWCLMLSSFPSIVKSLLKRLSPSDYPVLNSRLFFEIWLTFVLDASLTSMRDLFYRLNRAGIEVDISTFSKACKNRQGENFCRIYVELIERLKRQHPATAQMLWRASCFGNRNITKLNGSMASI